MFVEPEAIGMGYGRLGRRLARARRLRFSELVIESDRFAEPFYLAMGAVRIGAEQITRRRSAASDPQGRGLEKNPPRNASR
jgi:hypothetical protein